MENGSDARYSPTGHLVFARLGTLIAMSFDLSRLEITGGPIGVVADLKQAVNATSVIQAPVPDSSASPPRDRWPMCLAESFKILNEL